MPLALLFSWQTPVRLLSLLTHRRVAALRTSRARGIPVTRSSLPRGRRTIEKSLRWQVVMEKNQQERLTEDRLLSPAL